MKKVLVIGIKGMAGHVIFKSLPELGNYDVYGIARNIESSNKVFNLDVFNTLELKKIIDLQFDVFFPLHQEFWFHILLILP